MTKFDAAAVHTLILEYQKTKDEAVFARIVEHTDFIARVVSAMYESTEPEIEDGIQEARIKIWQVLDKYNGDQTSLQAWLSNIIHNTLITKWRLKHNIESVPLDEEIVAEEPPDHPEDTTPATVAGLSEYLIGRFPSVKKAQLRSIAEITIDALSGGRSAKATIRDIRQRLFPDLRVSQVVIVFYSAVFWIRLKNFQPAYIETPPVASTEWSLVPELKQVVGSRVGDVLYTLFRGASIHFRIN